MAVLKYLELPSWNFPDLPANLRPKKNALDGICIRIHNLAMQWVVSFAETFESEFDDLPEAVQNELLARAKLLEAFGPDLGRPHVDTLNGSAYPNMKELRFRVDDGVWRVAFAFDPERAAILLVAGDKAGVKQQRFYKQLIRLADQRFKQHLDGTE